MKRVIQTKANRDQLCQTNINDFSVFVRMFYIFSYLWHRFVFSANLPTYSAKFEFLGFFFVFSAIVIKLGHADTHTHTCIDFSFGDPFNIPIHWLALAMHVSDHFSSPSEKKQKLLLVCLFPSFRGIICVRSEHIAICNLHVLSFHCIFFLSPWLIGEYVSVNMCHLYICVVHNNLIKPKIFVWL